ncbi:tyrosine-type recombinase/integrase [Cesiribacter sp. SM1]|uniref:tyrosine-type recombinase/integrase n=1 Tax=Cesiribacter sp. SM1 TaxID=2861196 RepID=UPI001CD7F73B|nr:tyrosine-type recombinase/integrase [Cesiribacter sp. SM1]
MRGELSHQTYLTGLNRFFDYMDMTGGSFDGRTLDAFVRDMLTGRLPKQEGGISVEKEFSAFTINCYLSAVRVMAKWILEEHHLLSSPYQFTEEQLKQVESCLLVKGLQQEKRFYKDALDEGERDLLLRQAENSREQAVLELMAFCGLRTVEVTRLYVEDLDFRKHVLQVRRKGRHSKSYIMLFENCHASLKAYIGEEQPRGLLFGELKTWQIRKLVNRCLASAGLKTRLLSAHSLRHTAAQIMLNKGFSNTQVQLQLGHSSYETTLFYTRKQEEKQWRTRTSI